MPNTSGKNGLWDEWQQINWKTVEKAVMKLQKHIYQASTAGNVALVRALQKRLTHSWFAKLLAVRRITQENLGRKTAGVDGVKNLKPTQRMKLALNLDITRKAKSIKRITIPKPGKTEKRHGSRYNGGNPRNALPPLGISTMHDRASQCLVKMAMEPEWEAKFHAESYGFRPGRSTHDAIEAIFQSLSRTTGDRWFIEADIEKCNDRINHDYLLNKLATYPGIRQIIKGWLKAGCLDGTSLFPIEVGTPQGGVISPLLANIALHGIEESFSLRKVPSSLNTQYKLVRYANDFVIIFGVDKTPENTKSPNGRAGYQAWIDSLNEFLKPIGLRVKETKTKEVKASDGFDFLGFNIRKYQEKAALKTIIKPSIDAVSRHIKRLKGVIDSLRHAPQQKVIATLNPIICRWCNYYRTICAKETFHKCDYDLFQMLWGWAYTRCHGTGKRDIKRKYWGQGRGWKFDSGEFPLLRHEGTKIVRHTKVKGVKSPYDGDYVYWGQRLSNYANLKTRVQTLLKKQGGKCNECGLKFRHNDAMEVDHKIPRKSWG
ncbi:MAG: reverse transcriptase domain-containing protein [Nostoc sp.]|uniref:group II intron reverse transcriptase/maturase n=1 Tax=Nostoc sp. TaxID=1180 RepID=UPI002FF63032